jgi:23S rRNA pseudouridine2605 synthase
MKEGMSAGRYGSSVCPELAITSPMAERADGGEKGEQRDHHGRGERIAKVIARAGLASRREAERWISEGRVRVNAQVIASPAVTVTAKDIVAVDGQALPRRERTRLFLFHKPRGFLTSHGDPRGRPTIFDLVPKQLPRLISVGRLDLNTEGLLLLTNDGSLARVLELPSTGWLRRYRVRAHGRVTQQDLDSLRDGITIDGVRYGPIEATADRLQGTNVWMTFAIREGKNREVKNVLGHLGLAVNRLIRVSFGPFQLGDLPSGKTEEVRTRVLREQLGARIAALAHADFSAPVITTASGREPGSSSRRDIPPPARGRSATPDLVGGSRVGGTPMPGLRQARVKDPHPTAFASRAKQMLSTSPLQGEVQEPATPPWRHRPPRQRLRPGDKSSSRKKSRSESDHVGEPERARREKRRRRGHKKRR